MLLGLDAQNLDAKERHFILLLVIKTFIMQYVAFISSISQVFPVVTRRQIAQPDLSSSLLPRLLASLSNRLGGTSLPTEGVLD